jgi:hypothetical protein
MSCDVLFPTQHLHQNLDIAKAFEACGRLNRIRA